MCSSRSQMFKTLQLVARVPDSLATAYLFSGTDDIIDEPEHKLGNSIISEAEHSSYCHGMPPEFIHDPRA